MVSGIGALRTKDKVTICIGDRHLAQDDRDISGTWFTLSPEEAVEFAGMLLRVGTEHLREEKKDGDQGPPELSR